jgi:hypothetical protein
MAPETCSPRQIPLRSQCSTTAAVAAAACTAETEDISLPCSMYSMRRHGSPNKNTKYGECAAEQAYNDVPQQAGHAAAASLLQRAEAKAVCNISAPSLLFELPEFWLSSRVQSFTGLPVWGIPVALWALYMITHEHTRHKVTKCPGHGPAGRLGNLNDGFWKQDYGWGVRVCRHFGARGRSSVRYGTQLGDLTENWFLLFSN